MNLLNCLLSYLENKSQIYSENKIRFSQMFVIKVKLIFAFIFLNMKLKIGLFILTKLNKMLSLSKRLNMIPYNTQLNCFSQKW